MEMSQASTLLSKKMAQVTKGSDWVIISEYLAGRRDSLVPRLISCQTDDLHKLQGSIAQIDELLRLAV